MEFLKKNLSNILFFGFIIFLFTPYGLPVRALLIKGVSYVTTRVLDIELDKDEQVKIAAFDWQLADQNGNQVNLSDYQGKVVLVNFWATWCPPCIAEMPSYQELYDDYKDKMVFLFVANDDPEKVVAFMKQNAYTLPYFFPVSQVPAEMQSRSIPTTYVIDKTGKIVIDKTGAADWNSEKIRKVLDKLIQ